MVGSGCGGAGANWRIDNVKQRYHQCMNIECSATFRTTEAIDEVIRPPAEKTPPVAEPVTPPAPRNVQGCYSSPYRH
ncbi:ogr/Delta-like zinc finger family protein [Klebsiella pneumoniae]|nr:ogr/Delta-like zinc finger family protein [Klebsiella pneumoniae]